MTEHPAKPISLLICDDHQILTDALALVIAQTSTMALAAPPTPDPREAIDLCAKHQPDVVLMDIEFKGTMNGIEATRELLEVSPATRVVIMTAHEDDTLMVEAVEAGATGFLAKTEAADQVLSAVQAAAQGEVLIDPESLTRLLRRVSKERRDRELALRRLDELTQREREILGLLAQGMRNDDVARDLSISPQTVQTHIRNILQKLGVHSRLEAVAFAVRNGAISV